METTEIIGIAIFAVAMLAMTFQTAFAYGARCGQNKERLLGDRRVRGVLDYENKRRPKSQKAKRQRARKAARLAVGSVGVVTLLGGLQ
jgi:hypothetical protein